MKKLSILSIILCLVLLMSACVAKSEESTPETDASSVTTEAATEVLVDDGICDIILADSGILVEGNPASDESSETVYTARDIIYYEDNKDLTYGAGDVADAHSKQEADEHTVVHITKAGVYRLTGKLSKGQVAIDLGKDAKDNSDAVVTLILDGVDITCEVAPAVIFYNVYECSSDDTEGASKEVDTSLAGANVIIADDSENIINGSYVAKIYKPESVELSADGTEVLDASKLHKYDGAFYSKMSMNVRGGEKGNGVLNIKAENEGLDSELHLTINGGIINIKSGNDGINTNEDNVSVTTINGGELNITVTGETGEGDGIDSNGWLVINGGSVKVQACSFSEDAGIDSDMGIHINGGTVFATGSMLDRIEDGGQNYIAFRLNNKQSGNAKLSIKDADGNVLDEISTENDYSILIYSSKDIEDVEYYLYNGESQLAQSSDDMNQMGGPGMPPDGMGGPGMPPFDDHF